MQHLHARMAAHHAAGERHDYSRLNHEIHVALVAAAKNTILSATHATLLAQARRGRYAALESQERWGEVLDEHDALMAALVARDASAPAGSSRSMCNAPARSSERSCGKSGAGSDCPTAALMPHRRRPRQLAARKQFRYRPPLLRPRSV